MAIVRATKIKTQKGKQIITGILFLLLFAAAIVGILFAFNMQQREIEVVACKGNILMGSQITEDNLCPMVILKKEYDSKNDAIWSDSKGNQYKGQTYIKWEDRNDAEKGVVGKYAVNPCNADDYLTRRDIQSEKIEQNPWYEKVAEGSEFYTLKFDSSDTYTRLLMPGAVVRMRIITKVDASKADEYRQQISNKTGTGDGVDDKNGYLSAILPFYSAENGDDTDGEIPIAEVVFDNLQIVDAINADGQSIFDIFYSLANMENGVRAQYINNNYAALKEQIIPDTLILILTPEQASSVAEFENVDLTSYKYTVVKTDVEEDLYVKFQDIAANIAAIRPNTNNE